ncbi:MAG: bifunctional 5,10-methylene-tetrahydrofolate dehydrogenase/5,10-methylene-tetrahydrofolate cyclohydrolase [Coriobacteriales bacterium]|nr:bifunctional 5,10-methylene-tetrahydrofolate dehydrogenase/5,10-methylene-tetrahydrofolate cyclohydrolase [Coriobacteriales bacterium]
MAQVLSGKEVAAALNERIAAEVEELKAQGVEPTLAILRVGERADDLSYERGATKRADSVGVAVKKVVLPEDTDRATLLAEIEKLNADDSVHGVLMFRPLPNRDDDEAARNALAPEKDIDGITDGSMVGVFANTKQGFAPCTAQACIEILDHYGIDPKGKRVTIIGRSLVIGRPVAMMLMHRHATITICHTRTIDIPSITKEADIVLAAAGVMESVDASYFKPGQIVIDVGINWNEEQQRLCGDVKFDEVEPIVDAITPVPGGVGSVTTSVLISHVVEAAKRTLA